MVATIQKAIDMPEDEARMQIQRLNQRIRRHNLSTWTQDMLDMLKTDDTQTASR
jgi:trehalose-6-phosphate synthase